MHVAEHAITNLKSCMAVISILLKQDHNVKRIEVPNDVWTRIADELQSLRQLSIFEKEYDAFNDDWIKVLYVMGILICKKDGK